MMIQNKTSMKNIIDFYQNYDEESRLTTGKAKRIEFVTTTHLLNNHIQSNHKIIELGAGTGVYSFYYAAKGCHVVATDISPRHIEIIKQKLNQVEDKLQLDAKVANAIDLSEFENESHDVVLCLGPMYHLTEAKDRLQCIEECKRVLKKGGLLAVAYLNKHFAINYVMKKKNHHITHKFIDKILDTGVIRTGEKECFWTDAFFTNQDEIESFIASFDLEIIDHVATDGVSPMLNDAIDCISEEQYNAWIYYHLKSCRDKSIMGLSNHGLLLARKN